MNSFLQSVRSSSSSKEIIIKNSICSQLSVSVKDLQLCGIEENLSGDSLDFNDAANNLCSTVEAMFLHGIKDSLLLKARRAISNDVDQRPQPSFWSPILVFSHRQIIDQISSLPNITTEIGQCRAWIRLALNDAMFSSYLTSMIQDSDALKPYYKTSAFVRDTELLDVARKLIETVEMSSVFTLPCNSSLLNTWSVPTLLLAGIWSPTLRQIPIADGVDVAQSLNNTPSLTTNSNATSMESVLTSHSSEMSKMLAMNEDEALKIILSNSLQENSEPAMNLDTPKENDETRICSNDSEKVTVKECATSLGNSLNRKSGWSFDESQNNDGDVATTSSKQVTRSVSIEGGKSTEHSYHALIESYNMGNGSYVKTPDLRKVWQHLDENVVTNDGNIDEEQDLSPADQMGFEFVTASSLSKAERNAYLLQIGKLPREKGLDEQNYECISCKHPIGINVSKPRLCEFSGYCFCNNCMSPEAVMIPARIIHNWDFKTYYISKKVAMFLNDIKNHPVLDLKLLNPYIYTGVEEMAKLQSLRIQLNYLRDYLYTCREPVIEEFQKLVWPREYLYEHIHLYSYSDLLQISSNVLAQNLQKVVNFGRDHVMGCWLCSQKGFVCERCDKSKILYPFDVETTYRCNTCNAVFHAGCLDSTKPCPKCERIRKREDLSLLNATLE